MISVIVPIYNAEKYLVRCVDSILAQTYKEIEIILINDGSTDQSENICNEYAKRDQRIRVIHQKNEGVSCARNRGIDESTGEYLSFIDSDDWIDCTMYDDLIRLATKYDADIVECGYRWIKPDTIYDRENTGKIDIYTNLEALNQLYYGDQLFGGISIVPWNKLYRRGLFDSIRYPEGFIYEDVGTTPKTIYAAKRVVKYNKNLYNFYFSPDSITRSEYSLKSLDSIAMRHLIMNFFNDKGLNELHDYMEASYLGAIIYNYCECYGRRSDGQYAESAVSLVKRFREGYRAAKPNRSVRKDIRNVLFEISPQAYYYTRKIAKSLNKG